MAGFDVIAGADSEPKYMATFAHNFEDKRSYQIDLSSKSSDELMKKLSITEGSLVLKERPQKIQVPDRRKQLAYKSILELLRVNSATHGLDGKRCRNGKRF